MTLNEITVKTIFLSIFFSFALSVNAEMLFLKDGSTIQGKIISGDSLFFTVKTSFGTVIIDRSKIQRIESSEKAESIGTPVSKPTPPADETDSLKTIRLRRDWFSPFSISSTGLWTIGIGYRRGVVPDAYSEIELDYGHWDYSGLSYDYVLFPVSAVYGKGIGLDSPWWQFKAGIGGRIAVGYQSVSYGGASAGDWIFVPYIIGVLKIPIVWLEADLFVLGGEPVVGTRILLNFDDLFKAIGGSKD